MIEDRVQGHAPYIVKFTNQLIERDWSLITKKPWRTMPVTASIKLLPEYHTYGREQKKSATIMIADWVQEQAPAGGDGEIKYTTSHHFLLLYKIACKPRIYVI